MWINVIHRRDALRPLLLAAFLTLGACSPAAPDPNDSFAANVSDVEDVPASEGNEATAAAVGSARDYSGRWLGVEGMVLDVTKRPEAGRYTLAMQYDLDHKATVEGRAEGDAIVFERDGRTLRLRPTDGAATGLKYLDGKTDCLTVAQGEGYCRA
jgi:hypothetical protein